MSAQLSLPSLGADQPLRQPLTQVLTQVLAPVPPDWAPLVRAWQDTPAGQGLLLRLAARQRAGAVIYPAQPLRALALTPRAAVRVVILGQDPYHGAGQAEGLAFSVPIGVRPPPSLRNILSELSRSLAVPQPPHGHLAGWARQGVLLLNSVLTVEDGQPAAHARWGWEALTDALITATAADAGAKIYLLWGTYAQAKAPLIEAAGGGRHRVLLANHPSPLAARRPPRPFIGCDHFAQVQQFLATRGDPPIDWSA